MRQIKFRAWTKRWGMVYPDKGFSIDVHARTVWEDSRDEMDVWEDSRDEMDVELMQFTGLTDSTGKEIYEGDILYHFNEEQNVKVEFINGSFCFYGTKKPHIEDGYCLGEFASEMKVIGNILETPELLQ